MVVLLTGSVCGACQWAHCRPDRQYLRQRRSSSRFKATLEQLPSHRCLSSLAVWPVDGRRAAHTRFRGYVGHVGANGLWTSARKSCPFLRRPYLPRLGPCQPAFTLPNPPPTHTTPGAISQSCFLDAQSCSSSLPAVVSTPTSTMTAGSLHPAMLDTPSPRECGR